jgi:SAM-dependent methyltransferase
MSSMSEGQIRNLLEQAESAAEPTLVPGTSLALVKQLILRVLRVYTAKQTDFNRALLSASRLVLTKLQQVESAAQAGVSAAKSAQEFTDQTKKELQLTKAGAEHSSSEIAAARLEAARAMEAGKRAVERMEWLVQWTDTFRKELFLELRHRIEEHERVTRPEILDRQAYLLKVQGMPDGLRVNLGAGPQKGSNYITVDQRAVDGIDIRADIRHLPFEDGQLAEIHCSHLVEHFPDAEMRAKILPYWHRLLRPGGKLVVICPDAEAMMKRWAEGKFGYEDLREVTFGGQEYEGNQHYNMFTPSSLEQILRQASFREVRQIAVGRVNGKCLEMEFEAIK